MWKKMLAQDKKGTCLKNCMESSKRESDVLVVLGEIASSRKVDDHTRAITKKGLEQLREVKDEEKAAKELQEEVQERMQQLEGEFVKKIEDYIVSWDPERRR